MNNTTTLHQLKIDIATKIGVGHYTVSDGSQSFVVYPTNHIEVIADHASASIEVAKSVYGNVTVYDQVMEQLKELFTAAVNASDSINDSVCVNVTDCDKTPFNVSFGGLDRDIDTYHLESISAVLEILKTY